MKKLIRDAVLSAISVTYQCIPNMIYLLFILLLINYIISPLNQKLSLHRTKTNVHVNFSGRADRRIVVRVNEGKRLWISHIAWWNKSGVSLWCEKSCFPMVNVYRELYCISSIIFKQIKLSPYIYYVFLEHGILLHNLFLPPPSYWQHRLLVVWISFQFLSTITFVYARWTQLHKFPLAFMVCIHNDACVYKCEKTGSELSLSHEQRG